MSFCPQCGDEFQDWVRTCPDCGAGLAAELPAAAGKSGKGPEPLVHIANAPNEPTARMWVGLLENNGIRATAKGRAYRGGGGGSDSPFLPVEIYVLESDAEGARHFLPREALRG